MEGRARIESDDNLAAVGHSGVELNGECEEKRVRCEGLGLTIPKEDELLEKHRQERKKLQDQILKLKKGSNKTDKKKKKDVNAQIALLQVELEKKHAEEMKQLQTQQVTSVEDGVNDMHVTEKKVSKAQRRRERKEGQKLERERCIAEAEAEDTPRKQEMAQIQAKLDARNLQLVDILSDGDCLYNAIRVQLNEVHTVEELRHLAADYIREHRETFQPFLLDEEHLGEGDPVHHYCLNLENTKTWGGQVELQALSGALKCRLEVIQGDAPTLIFGDDLQTSLILTYHRFIYGLGEHYNAAMPLSSSLASS
ncbi:unnamed protein product [Darwinula stevensoni]|uniref:OTU domain-containing protein n=1 Tax=Darwinula stevensoni TaxID=69355 RepID=A0A7R9AAN4_9CRUS|nr:unnamed protein product [Darwinula stevensoni]CAG0898625.1 unnamed protein product [Darwinula stevensoni]